MQPRLIPPKETLTVEFKSDRAKLPDRELVENAVALANTDGGRIFLGVEDDGTVTGLHRDHRDPIGLDAMIANNTVPPLTVRAEIITEEGLDVMQIEVIKSTAIVATASGRLLKRRLKVDGEPENVPLYPYEIPGRLSDLSRLDYSAQPIPDSSEADIDPLERERIRRFIRTRQDGEKKLLELSDPEFDRALHLTTEVNQKTCLTICGMLLMGKEASIRKFLPTAKAGFQVLEGSDIKLNEDFSTTILSCFETFETYFNARNEEQELERGLTRIPIPDYAPAAFREGLVNAFSHRDYSRMGQVRVLMDNEGLTIENPGGFIEGVTYENLLTVPPRSRNPLLSDNLKRIGLNDKAGRGVDRIYIGSMRYGRPWPDYSGSTSAFVKLFIPKAQADLSFVELLLAEQSRLGRDLQLNELLILSALQQGSRLTVEAIAELTHLAPTRVMMLLEKMVESGLVEGIGTGRHRNYILNAELYKQRGRAPEYVRQSDIDDIRYEELILKLADQQDGFVTKKDVASLLRINDADAKTLIDRLREQNKLALYQSGRYAKYIRTDRD